MKTLLSCVLLMISVSCFSQEIPKKANTIIIKSISFKEVVDTLLNHNYFFDKVDSMNNTITTQPKDINGYSYIFNFRIKNNIAYLSGRANDNVRFMSIEPSYSEINNYGMKGSPAKNAFNILNSIATLFNKEINYTTQ